MLNRLDKTEQGRTPHTPLWGLIPRPRSSLHLSPRLHWEAVALHPSSHKTEELMSLPGRKSMAS